MSRLADGVVIALRTAPGFEAARRRRASWPVGRLLVKPVAYISVLAMVFTQWVTRADDRHDVGVFVYGGIFAIGTAVVVVCLAFNVRYWFLARKADRR